MFCLPPCWDNLHPCGRREHFHWSDSILFCHVTRISFNNSPTNVIEPSFSLLVQASTLSRAYPKRTLRTRPTSPSSSSPSSSSPSSPSSPASDAVEQHTSPAACSGGELKNELLFFRGGFQQDFPPSF